MVEKLRQLGWSEYESKIYLALLRHHPATGYRVAREAGVPSAKVYEALARLSERGVARVVSESGESVQYAPVAPDEVLAGVRARQARMLDELGEELSALFAPQSDLPDTEWLRGRAPVLGRASSLIAMARRSIAIAIPAGLESGLRVLLEAAAKRHVSVEIAEAPALGSAAPNVGRLFALAVDGTDALLGALSATTDDMATEALATRVPYLVRFCQDHVRYCHIAGLLPDMMARLHLQKEWLDWEEEKQRRLLQRVEALPATRESRSPR